MMNRKGFTASAIFLTILCLIILISLLGVGWYFLAPNIITNNLAVILFGCAILVLIVILVISFNNSDEYSGDSFGTGRHGGGSSGGGGATRKW
jgi:uncharacterized membrane protein YgcG